MVLKTKKIMIKLNKHVFLSDDFNDFWNKIKYKSSYHVDFDSDEFIYACIYHLKKLDINYPHISCIKSIIDINSSGVKSFKLSSSVYNIEWNTDLPDIVKFLQNETDLTRKTIVKILIESDTLDLFKKNPQEYMFKTLNVINRLKEDFYVDGIKYIKIDDYYPQELFKNDELFGYLDKNLIESKRSIYDYVFCESEVEKNFVLNLENDSDVKLYFKLPKRFKIKTPLGNYTPDLAVLFEFNGEKIYYVLEVTGHNYTDLRPKTRKKINCAHKHFESLGFNVLFEVVTNYEEFKYNIINYLNL